MKTRSCSERLYALLLKCFPRAYQEAFADPMLCAFRDMLEQQPAWVVWRIALKEFPGTLMYEYLSPFKGDRKGGFVMKRTTLSKGIRCGFILGTCWFLTALEALLNVLTHFSSQGNVIVATIFLIGTVLITPFLYGTGGFLCGRSSQRVLEGVYTGLLTACISTLMFLISARLASVLGRQIVKIPMGFMFFNVSVGGTSARGPLVFFFTSLLAGALFGLIGWLLGKVFSRRNVAAAEDLGVRQELQ